MRLGKWIRIFNNIVPIPLTFSAAFGLRQGSVLHIAAMPSDVIKTDSDAEIIISPIPLSSWRSVCRLSVRLSDLPGALAKASEFLRKNKINVLLTEAAATFQERAHWDAVCDLTDYPDFIKIRNIKNYESYEKEMKNLLDDLTRKLHTFANQPDNEKFFLAGIDFHAEFIILPGLNIVSFKSDISCISTSTFYDGAIELESNIEKFVTTCLTSSNKALINSIPSHALITGNTEQRYLRLYFIRNVNNFVMAEISCEIEALNDKGIGVLNQILKALPPEANLLHLSVFQLTSEEHKKNLAKRRQNKTKPIIEGRLKIICHWPNPNRSYLQQAVEAIQIEDSSGISHSNLCKLKEFQSPRTIHPRVFISFSCHENDNKNPKLDQKEDLWRLTHLQNMLKNSNFEPIMGTKIGDRISIGGEFVSPDVVSSAFEEIKNCVAFISLQTKRQDYCVRELIDPSNPKSQYNERFILPPWLIAEEVFAYSRGVRYLVRLQEHGVEEPKYNQNTHKYIFRNKKEYIKQVESLIRKLNEIRESEEFEQLIKNINSAMFLKNIPPE